MNGTQSRLGSTVAEDLRRRFLLDPRWIHLNHGAFGACPRPVFRAYQRYQKELEQRPVEFLARRYSELLAAANARLAAFVGVPESSALVFVPNTTTALNAVAASVPLSRGDEVFTTSLEYGAMLGMWREYTRRRGARLVVAPIRVPVRGRKEIIEDIWSRVNARTRVLFVSHIASDSAIPLPVQELCGMARAAGLVSVVDGAHAPGLLPLDVAEIGATCYAGDCHKWLCAPKGSAFLVADESAQEWVASPIVSWGWTWTDERAFESRFQWQGTRDPAAFLAVPNAIDFLSEHRWDLVRTQCRQLAETTLDATVDRFGLEPLTPCGPEWCNQMVALPLPSCDPKELQGALRARHRIDIPIRLVGERVIARLSVQGYTTPRDCDALMRALSGLLDPNRAHE